MGLTVGKYNHKKESAAPFSEKKPNSKIEPRANSKPKFLLCTTKWAPKRNQCPFLGSALLVARVCSVGTETDTIYR